MYVPADIQNNRCHGSVGFHGLDNSCIVWYINKRKVEVEASRFIGIIY